MEITIGATLTGGSSITYSPAGNQPGKSVLVGPGHTYLSTQRVEFTSTAPVSNAKEPGTARTGVKITFGTRETEEGCCTAQQGTVIIDLGVRWNLNQSEAVADATIALLKGLVYTPEFTSAVKKGILPAE